MSGLLSLPLDFGLLVEVLGPRALPFLRVELLDLLPIEAREWKLAPNVAVNEGLTLLRDELGRVALLGIPPKPPTPSTTIGKALFQSWCSGLGAWEGCNPGMTW